MRIAVTGSTGLIGSALVRSLLADGHQVVRLVRHRSRTGPQPDGSTAIGWNPLLGEVDRDGLAGVEAVVHLAGAGVGDRRWSDSYKRDIRESRAGEGFVSGLLLQFVNAKIYIYGIMSMEAYILPVYQGRALPLAGFALLLAFIGFLFTLCWSAFGSVFKLLFSRHAKLVNTLMALLLVYCAVSLFM